MKPITYLLMLKQHCVALWKSIILLLVSFLLATIQIVLYPLCIVGVKVSTLLKLTKLSSQLEWLKSLLPKVLLLIWIRSILM